VFRQGARRCSTAIPSTALALPHAIAVDSEIGTALMHAYEKGRDKIVKLLLDHKVIQTNLQNKDGWTAMMHADME
jgi:ankyrin repeat protein